MSGPRGMYGGKKDAYRVMLRRSKLGRSERVNGKIILKQIYKVVECGLYPRVSG